ncbi:MAG: glycosyltransferase family 4 protein [Bacteroidales bacterium]|nr:glycosyltransferase family 4 protein [Bacteroidales bacterium]
MKILHVVRQFYPMIGGMENYVYLLSIHQIASGDEVTVLTLDRNFMTNEKLPSSGLHDGIQIIRIPYLGINKYPIAFSAIRFVKGYDIVHIHGVDFFVDYLAFTRFLHRQRIILHTHGGFFHTRWGYWFKKIFFNTVTRVTVNLTDRVIAISNNDYKPFAGLTKKIVQIENGIHYDQYQSPKSVKKGTLLTVGRIDIHKRIDLLIKVTLTLIDRGHDVTLRIVGPDWKKMQSDLEKLIPKDKKDKIIFTGPVDDAQLLQEYVHAEVFLSASEYEGFGLTAVEAMASGTPVVLNNIDSFRVFLENKDFGSIAEFKDVEATATKIENFITLDQNKYRLVSGQAREYASNYSWKTIEKRIREVYLNVLNK